MFSPIHPQAPRPRLVALGALAVAFGALGSGCSGAYPLGDLSRHGDLLGTDIVPGADVGDATASATLGAPDVTISGDSATFWRPDELANVGDLDGDGKDDMAVSGNDLATGTPFIHVRYGSPRPHGSAEAFGYEQSGARLSVPGPYNGIITVTSAGDVDGDGYGDMLVAGTSECSPTPEGNGAYLVYGGPERLPREAAITDVAAHFVPPTTDGPPGCSQHSMIARAGDLDGDGIDDFVLDSTALQSGSTLAVGTGAGAYIFYGRPQRFSGEVPFSAGDAYLVLRRQFSVFPAGDVNGDGRADLLAADESPYNPPRPTLFLAGRGERWSGSVDLASNATEIRDTVGPRFVAAGGQSDVNGDGITDLVLEGKDDAFYLFYGAPGLFEHGGDLAQADVRLVGDATGLIVPVGDLDGDGDDELVNQFSADFGVAAVSGFDAVIVSGFRARLDSHIVLPQAMAALPTRFDDPNRHITWIVPAGDIDGDGASDLFTTSLNYSPDGDGTGDPQLHIHYGTLAPNASPIR